MCVTLVTLCVSWIMLLCYVLWHCWLVIRNSIWLVKTKWWGAGVVICLEQGANDLHMVHLMPLPPIISCFIKIHNGFTFLVLAYPGCAGKQAVKQFFKITAARCEWWKWTQHIQKWNKHDQKMCELLWKKFKMLLLIVYSEWVSE